MDKCMCDIANTLHFFKIVTVISLIIAVAGMIVQIGISSFIRKKDY